jgi:hypothetical protein
MHRAPYLPLRFTSIGIDKWKIETLNLPHCGLKYPLDFCKVLKLLLSFYTQNFLSYYMKL